jgi:adenine-specific DNA methylase
LDFKKNDWNDEYRYFDIVVGNPPYVCSRNLTEETREKLKQYEVCGTGHPDLYIPFFQIAIEMLANRGRMGFITMNTFLRSVNGRALRRFFSKSGYSISIVDFRGYQVFESRNTYTCLFYLDKFSETGTIRYAVDEKGELNKDVNYFSLPYNSLDDFKGWTLNNYEMTRLIEETGIQIKDYCSSRHGIATLSNETYIFRPVEEDEMYFSLDSDGKRFSIEKSICRDVVNPNKLHSVEQYDELVEKLLFPYKYVDNKVSIIDPEWMAVDCPGAWDYLNYKRKVLLSRDKGNTKNYPQWYAFGRTQSLILPRYKLFFPKFANHALQCLIKDDANLMLYNGLAFVSDDMRRLRILKSVIESELFWEYIRANAKPYASGYYSLSGVDIKHFGIPKFTQEEENALLSLEDKDKIEVWLRAHYDLG